VPEGDFLSFCVAQYLAGAKHSTDTCPVNDLVENSLLYTLENIIYL
jgi:hypothetical protein